MKKYITIQERMGQDDQSAIDKALDGLAFHLRVAMPGIIKGFNADAGTVEVQISIREDILVDGEKKAVEIPLLLDVPIIMPRAGNFVLTMPVTIGDECLVMFADCCMDYWWQNGGVQNQGDKRRHDLSDGFAILAPWSQPKKISGYSTSSAKLRSLDGATYVEVQDDTINVIAPVKVKVQAAAIEVLGNTTVTGETVSVTGTSSVIANGGAVTISGASLSLAAGGAAQVDGKNFIHHVHSGVQSGGSNTGEVV